MVLRLDALNVSPVRQCSFHCIKVPISWSTIKNFVMQLQQQSNWCWSACATSVGLFYQTGSWTQCDTASNVLKLSSTNCCDSPTPTACNVPWTLSPALQYTQSFWQYQSGTCPPNQVRSFMLNSDPLCVRVAWNVGGAHFMAISGYGQVMNQGGATLLQISDPIYGTTIIQLPFFPSQYHSGGKWTDSYWTTRSSS